MNAGREPRPSRAHPSRDHLKLHHPSKTARPRRAAGLLIGFLGAVVALAPWRTGAFTLTGIGQLACLLAAASYGVGYVYMRRFITGRGFSPLALAAGQLTVAAVLLAFTAPVTAREPVMVTAAVAASVLALGALGTGIAYILNYRLIVDEGQPAPRP